MRRIVAVFMLVVALQAPALGAEWTIFTHPDPPFSIRYPAEWVKISADKLALLVLVAPRRGLGFVVVGVPLTSGGSLNDLENGLSGAIAKRFADYQPLRTDRTTLAGSPAIIHYFTGSGRNGERMYVMLGAVTTSTHGYMLFGTTTIDSPNLNDDLALLQRIIIGFRPGR